MAEPEVDNPTPIADAEPASDPSPDALGWREALPEAYREHGYIKAHDSFENWLKHVDGMERARGRSIILPDNPESEDYQEKVLGIFRRLGAPETAEGYTFEVPEGAPMNPASLDAFRQSAAAAGVTKAQADTIFRAQVESARRQAAQQQEAKEGFVREMRESWGREVYDLKNAGARAMAQRMGLEELFDQHGWFAVPQFVESMYDVSLSYGLEAIPPNGAPSGQSYDEINQQITEIKRSPEYRDAGNPKNAETRQRVANLENYRAALRQRR